MTEDKQIPANPSRIRQLVQDAQLGGEPLAHAMRVAGFYPDIAAWYRTIRAATAVIGIIMLLAGIVLFFVYYWAHMHKLIKFSVLEIGMIAALLTSWKLGLQVLVSKLLITAASILMGVLLVVFAQTYPTGTQTYEIFLAWALMILPWTFMARFLVLWFIFVAILQIGLAFYWSQVLYKLPFFDPEFALSIVAINMLLLFAWEVANKLGLAWVAQRWFPNMLMLTLVTAITAPIIYLFFIKDMPLDPVNIDGLLLALLITYLVIICLVSWYYSKVSSDLFHLTLNMLSLITVVTVVCVQLLQQYVQQKELLLLLLGLIVIGQLSLATGWLMRTAKREAA